MITFPTVLNSERKWLFDYTAKTAEKNSDGGTSSSNPGSNYWQVEKGSSYMSSSGDWSSKVEDGSWKMEFAQSIGNSYYYTSYCGYLRHNSGGPGGTNYSPLYDSIATGLTFNWKKYDSAVASGKSKHRFRVSKFGLMHRTSSSSAQPRDTLMTTGCTNLLNFGVSSSVSSGTGELTFATSETQPIGFFIQLQTEGGGTGSTSGSWIKIWNVNWKSSKTKEAIMEPYTTYGWTTGPSKRKIWTA